VPVVCSGFGNYADLAAGARAVFGGIVAAVDSEFLNVFEALLQAEVGSCFAIQVSRGGIDDGAGLDTVVAKRILLIGAAAKANVVVGSASCLPRRV
jgi:hypothetical protein